MYGRYGSGYQDYLDDYHNDNEFRDLRYTLSHLTDIKGIGYVITLKLIASDKHKYYKDLPCGKSIPSLTNKDSTLIFEYYLSFCFL